VGNVRESPSPGSPTEIRNSWKFSTGMPLPSAAVQVTSFTALVTGPASVWMGVFTVNCVASAVQPGTGSTSASAIGWSVGNWTVTLVVVSGSFSFGTTN